MAASPLSMLCSVACEPSLSEGRLRVRGGGGMTPLALQSFPQGVEESGYFVKDAPGHFPDWIATAPVAKREGGTIHHVLAENAATLVYLAGQNVITPHVWTSRADRLERPDRLVFDLDPSARRFAEVRAAAPAFGDLLRELGLEPFVMTTGSRGLHVVTPVRRTADFDVAHAFARDVATALVEQEPAALTVEFRRNRAGSASTSTSAATRTDSTRSPHTRSAPIPMPRWRRRCAGRNSTIGGCSRVAGRSPPSAIA
jgi:DNA primase